MSRQDANAAFALTSFLYGGNAAYIEDLYAQYETDPKAVDAEWQAFFASLKDDAGDVAKNAEGPSWRRPDWPPRPRGDLVAAAAGIPALEQIVGEEGDVGANAVRGKRRLGGLGRHGTANEHGGGTD